MTASLLIALLTACQDDDNQDTSAPVIIDTADCDTDAQGSQRWVELWVDADEDGVTIDQTELLCIGEDIPYGYQAEASAEADCDDSDPTTFPGAPDITDDTIDQDCDGSDATAWAGDRIYVDVNDPNCQDLEAGSIETPNCQLEPSSFFVAPGGVMFVAGGDYLHARLKGGRTYVGGFNPENWAHEPETHPTRLKPADNDPIAAALTALGSDDGGSELVLEYMIMEGSNTHSLINGVSVLGADPLILRHVTVMGGPLLRESSSTGVWALMGSARIEDSVIDGGKGTTCVGVSAWGPVELVNTRIQGCENAVSAIGVDVRGTAILEDVELSLEVPDGSAVGVQATGQAYLTGVVAHVHGGLGSTALKASGTGARLEIESSAIFGSSSGSPVSIGALAETEASLVAANSFFHGGWSTAEGSSAVAVTSLGKVTVVNSLLDAGKADAGSAVALHSVDGKATLVANDLWPSSALQIGSDSVSSLETINGCGWSGCSGTKLNRSEDPAFLDIESGSLLLSPTSPLVDAGVDPTEFGLIVDRDIEGLAAPSDGDNDGKAVFDVGPHER